MTEPNQTHQPTTFTERLKGVCLVMAYLIAIIGVLLYGLIFTTNLLTQLNPATGWFYLAVGASCYTLVSLTIYLLYRKLMQAINRAFSS